MINNKLKGIIAASVIALTVTACSNNRDLYAPVEAPEIDNIFEPESVWTKSTQGADDFFSQLVPCVSKQQLFIAGRDGKVYAIDVKNGDTIWKIDLSDEEENDNKRSARLNGGMISNDAFVAVGSENGYIYVLNRNDGSIYFKYYLGSEIITRPVFSASGDKLFVLDSVGRISAFDLTLKNKIWESGDLCENLHLRTQAKPVAVGDELVILGTPSGRVMMISQQDGFVLNQVTIGQNNGSSDLERMSDVSSTPLLLGNNMYSTAYNAGFVSYALDKQA
ncbi:MAG: PQQ-binding-like beta-propeller repeat protein, partial [Succinivibrio sp.]